MKRFPRPTLGYRQLAFDYHYFVHRSTLRAALFALTGIWL